MKKGDRTVTLENFYEADMPELIIKLDPRLSPAQNAQKYYAEYRKAATAGGYAERSDGQIASGA